MTAPSISGFTFIRNGVELGFPFEASIRSLLPLVHSTKPALVVVTDCEVKITQQIHFEFNKDKIRPESFPVLDAVVEALQKNPAIKIEVQGHTDNVGQAAYNQKLSERRAAQVAGLLKSPMQRLAAVLAAVVEKQGGGAEAPAADASADAPAAA